MHNVEFICQREQDFIPDDSCHAACLLMLLKFIDFKPVPTYQQLCVALNLTNDSSQSYPNDTSMEEVLKYVVQNNIPFRCVFCRDDWVKALHVAPIMVAMYGCARFWGDEGHTVILVDLTSDNEFIYLDPWFSAHSGKNLKRISMTEFYQYYTGTACQLLP